MRAKFTNILLLFITLSGCDLINPDEKLPTYIQVDDFELNRAGQKITKNISDVWVKTSTQDLGIYELPTTIPILEDGSFEIVVSPGVYLNGVLSSRSKYFYYKPYRETIQSTGNSETIIINPETSYVDAAVFSEDGSEDFEGTEYNLEAANGKKITYENDNTLLEDNRIGVLYSGNGVIEEMEIKSVNYFKIDNDKVNAPVFLEFDYKTTVNMEIGLYISFEDLIETVPFISVFETNGEWIHTYVQLDNEVNISGKETEYKIFFRANSSGAGTSQIALDNVTIVYSE